MRLCLPVNYCKDYIPLRLIFFKHKFDDET